MCMCTYVHIIAQATVYESGYTYVQCMVTYSISYQLTGRKYSPRFLAITSLIECTEASIRQVATIHRII